MVAEGGPVVRRALYRERCTARRLPHARGDLGHDTGMLAILGGLGAALCFTATTLCAARSSRLIGAASAVAWVMLVGLAVLVPVIVLTAPAPAIGAPALFWLVIAGVGNVAGLGLEYTGFRFGAVGVVGAIVSIDGAVAALLAIAAGEPLVPGAGVALASIVVGIVLAAASQAPTDGAAGRPGDRPPRRDGLAALFGLAAAVAFGLSLYGTGRAGTELPTAWAILPPRVVGVAVVALPLMLTRRLRLTREALPFVVAGGLAEVVGFASFTIGSRDAIAVAAVLASQFGALAAIAAFVLFGERLAVRQRAGVATIAVGVAVLTALRV